MEEYAKKGAGKVYLVADGISRTQAEWARELNVTDSAIYLAIKKGRDFQEFFDSHRSSTMVKKCAYCGVVEIPSKARGAPRKYCSDRCQEAARHERDKEKRNEASRKHSRKYYEINREKILKNSKAWAIAHPEESAEYQKNYRTRNIETVRAKAREVSKKERDIRRVYKREHRRNNPEKYREHRAKNIIRFRENERRYSSIRRTRKKGAGGSYTKEEWNALLDATGHQCLCCGMTGVNLTADHVIPVSCGGTSNIDNIQPLCKSCNSKKHAKTIDYRVTRVQL